MGKIATVLLIFATFNITIVEAAENTTDVNKYVNFKSTGPVGPTSGTARIRAINQQHSPRQHSNWVDAWWDDDYQKIKETRSNEPVVNSCYSELNKVTKEIRKNPTDQYLKWKANKLKTRCEQESKPK